MKQISLGIIGTGWRGGIRAVAAAASPWVNELHIAEIREEGSGEEKADSFGPAQPHDQVRDRTILQGPSEQSQIRGTTLACGFLLFSSKAEEYYYNPFFQTKVLLLVLVAVHALVFRGSMYGNPVVLDRDGHPPAAAKLAAGLSLVLCSWPILASLRGIVAEQHFRDHPPALASHVCFRKPIQAGLERI
jgi:hypothetical protein